MGIETIALIALAAGTAASVGGAVYSGVQAKQTAKQQSSQALINATIARESAKAEAEDVRRRARYMLGTQLAATGASGVQLEGSPLMVMLDTAAEQELEAQRRLYAGELTATGRTQEAENIRQRGQAAATASYIQAGSTLLTSGLQYERYKAGKSLLS